MMVTMLTWRDETTQVPEIRKDAPYALVSAYGLNAGFYKVQAVCQKTACVITEWKQPLNN